MSVRALIVDIIKFIYGHLGHANNTSMLRLLVLHAMVVKDVTYRMHIIIESNV